jgi:hypothetical protein
VSLRRALFVALTAWVAGVRVASAGAPDPVPQMVRAIESIDPIDALAVADVDNDGDLDILASVHDGQLLMWRNAGNGQFRLATAPSRRFVSVPAAHIGRCHHVEAPIQAGDDRYDAAMPRAPTVAAAEPVPARFAVHFVCVPVPVRQRPSGRAPPAHA